MCVCDSMCVCVWQRTSLIFDCQTPQGFLHVCQWPHFFFFYLSDIVYELLLLALDFPPPPILESLRKTEITIMKLIKYTIRQKPSCPTLLNSSTASFHWQLATFVKYWLETEFALIFMFYYCYFKTELSFAQKLKGFPCPLSPVQQWVFFFLPFSCVRRGCTPVWLA